MKRILLTLLTLLASFSWSNIAAADPNVPGVSDPEAMGVFVARVAAFSTAHRGEQMVRLVVQPETSTSMRLHLKVCAEESPAPGCLQLPTELRRAGSLARITGGGFLFASPSGVSQLYLNVIDSLAFEPAPRLVVSATSVDFGTVALQNFSDKVIYLKNTGDAPLNELVVMLPPQPQLTVVRSNCGSTLPARSACQVALRFTALSIGPFRNTLLIRYQATSAAQAPQAAVELLGMGDAIPRSDSHPVRQN